MKNHVLVFGLQAMALASSASAQSAVTLSNYAALGDSLTAGVVNGCVVETHQRYSYPALIARQAGLTAFAQPTITEPGIPAELQLVSLLPTTVIAPKSADQGRPNNLGLPRPYNNLGIPTATTPDYLSKTTDGGGPFDLVLRGLGTAVAQGALLRAGVYTIWLGNNDVLGAVVRGQATDGVTLTPTAAFRTAYGNIVAAIRSTGGQVVAATIPDVTALPYATTIPPYVVNPVTGAPVLVGGATVPLLGPTGPLPAGALVTLAASSLLAKGIGIPASAGGTGQALPGEVILDQAEVAVIQDRVRNLNQVIRDVAQAQSAVVLDLNGVFTDIATSGLNVGGVSVTTDFLIGGLFGYDGIHLTDLGYAIVANEWIEALRVAGYADLPLVSLLPFMNSTSASASTGSWTSLADGASSSSVAVRRAPVPFEFTAEAQAHLLRLFPTLER